MSQVANADKRIFDYTALHTAEQCERKFYWSVVRGLVPVEPSAAMGFGGAIHSGIHAWRSAGKDDAAGLAAFEEAMRDAPADDRRNVALGRAMLIGGPFSTTSYGKPSTRMCRGYFDRYRDEPFRFLAGEVGFALPMPDGSTLCGRIDGVVKWDKFIYVLETKTTSSLGSTFMRGFKPNLQVSVYTYAVWRTFGQCDGAVIDAISTATSKAGTDDGFLRDVSERTLGDMRDFERHYLHLAQELNERLKRYAEVQSDGEETAMRAYPQRYAACHAYFGACPYLKLCTEGEAAFIHQYEPREVKVCDDELTQLGGVARSVGGFGNGPAGVRQPEGGDRA